MCPRPRKFLVSRNPLHLVTESHNPAGVARGRRAEEWGIANWIFGFKRTRVTRVSGFWHNPGLPMTKANFKAHLPKPPRPTKEPQECSWILLARSPTKRLKRMANCLARFRQARKAEEESAHQKTLQPATSIATERYAIKPED
jgi:hypothetical protein